MNAAVVHDFAASPKYTTFSDPVAESGSVIVTVKASALSQLVKAQASGKHYSSPKKLPFVPGVDGVGALSDGSRVYFAFPHLPYGAMAEQVAVAPGFFVPLPAELDDVSAAAIANPGMSSWAALTERAKLVQGETVLVNGATGTSGHLAVQIAKHLGAVRVIATGRNPERLQALLAAGADEIISLELPEAELGAQFARAIESGVNVVLDYLWGKSAEQIIVAIARSGSHDDKPRVRFVQIGSMSGTDITLPAAALRSSGLELIGSGIGSVSPKNLIAAIGAMLNAVVPAGFRIETEAVPLTDVETAWSRDTGERRLVFVL